jgi:hypothetical protein
MPRRVAIAALFGLLVAFMGFPPAVAVGGTPGCAAGIGGWHINCKGGVSTGSGGPPSGPTSPPPGGSGTTTTADPKNVIDIAEQSNNDGNACYIVDAVNTAGLDAGEIATLTVISSSVMFSMPPCPNQPQGGVPVAQPTPVQLATNFWDTVRLPVPKPRTKPDFAVTGKVTYLAAGDTNTPPAWTRTTPFGLLSISAHGTYTVDWGDGTPTTGPYANPGGPYPSGTITHTYDNTGTVTITVREDWTATWSIGALHGTLEALHTTGTDPGFVVRQIQAVITQSG